MNEENSHEGSELFATPQNEELATEASTTQDDELFESSSKSEESEEKPAKTSTADEIRQKQIDAWQKKIDLGEVQLEDLPQNQKWIAQHLKAKNVDVEKLADEIIERKLKAREEEKSFKALRSNLDTLDISSKKKTALTEEYNDLRSSGLSKTKALEKAMKIVGIQTASRGEELPPIGGYSPKVEKEDLTSEDRVKKLEALRKGNRRLQS